MFRPMPTQAKGAQEVSLCAPVPSQGVPARGRVAQAGTLSAQPRQGLFWCLRGFRHDDRTSTSRQLKRSALRYRLPDRPQGTERAETSPLRGVSIGRIFASACSSSTASSFRPSACSIKPIDRGPTFLDGRGASSLLAYPAGRPLASSSAHGRTSARGARRAGSAPTVLAHAGQKVTARLDAT
jgi:hypothetical protein